METNMNSDGKKKRKKKKKGTAVQQVAVEEFPSLETGASLKTVVKRPQLKGSAPVKSGGGGGGMKLNLGDMVSAAVQPRVVVTRKKLGKVQKSVVSARRQKERKGKVVRDEHGNRLTLVTVGKRVVAKRKKTHKSLSKLKKKQMRERLRTCIEDSSGKFTEEQKEMFRELLESTVPKKSSAEERKAMLEALPPVKCLWEGCEEVFSVSKESMERFREHLVKHARTDGMDEDGVIVCKWQGCPHGAFIKTRTLRLHAARHAKTGAPKPDPVWTKDSIKQLEEVPRADVIDVAECLELPCSEEIDTHVTIMIKELQTLQTKGKGKQRFIVGIRQTRRDVNCNEVKLLLVCRRMEGIDEPGSPFDQLRKLVELANEKGVPVCACLSRRKLAQLTCPKKRNTKYSFGVTAMGITSAEGAFPPFKAIVELINGWKPA